MPHTQLLTRTDKALPARQLANALVQVAVARGADEQKLLRGTGIFSEDLLTSRAISAEQFMKLVGNAQKQYSGDDLAFQFGHYLVSAFVNDALPYFTHTAHFAECVRAIPVFQTRICPFLSAHRYDYNDEVFLVLQDAMGCAKQFVFMAEAFCAALMVLARHCTGKRLPFSFDFPYRRPRHIQEYEEGLGFRLRFEQPFFTVRINRQALLTPCLQANQAFKQFALRRYLEQRQFRRTLLDTVRFRLRYQAVATLPAMAKQLGLSPATLKRKLAEHDTTFSLLHDDVRRQQAIFYLQVQKLNNEQSALKMAFSDITNFRRAVKRWTGSTPSQLREV
ncbi:helix-turn-helix domain-containing protein [Alteromonas gilva]|uniref:Helix-turn-helix domain-containing protein n=1 Tax=Alteromonas gilva TaxID=2987522 RepID=A0ABT5L5N6_9ALTE|nr:helix-turn-helix domain-containing protein [Alteromonas gilva]MDC8832349.1 helix-turn-helix domain-containing protein [Alteromonas gilva]